MVEREAAEFWLKDELNGEAMDVFFSAGKVVNKKISKPKLTRELKAFSLVTSFCNVWNISLRVSGELD